MSTDDKAEMRHRPGDIPTERDLEKLREELESGDYEVAPLDVADAMLRGGLFGGFSLPRSIRPG